MSSIILDLDNCICDDEWRIPNIMWDSANPIQRYHHYHGLAAFDKPGNTDLFLNAKLDIIIFTARPNFYMAPTVEWLNRNGITPSFLMMREGDDRRSSKEIKRSFLVKLVNVFMVRPESIFCAYDDRQDIVDMYRSLGLTAEVRKIHDTCAYSRPSAIIK